jgi:hypothetical protein
MTDGKGGGFKLSQLAVDTTKSEDGVWIEFGAGFELLIARANNAAFKAELARLVKPYQREIAREGMSSRHATDAHTKAQAKCVVLNWRGLEDEDGEPIPYSPEKAFEILSDPRYPELKEFVDIESNNLDNFRAEDQADAEGK